MFDLAEHSNHYKNYYYPSNKFKFASNEEQIFFTTSKWQNHKNYNTVVKTYNYFINCNYSICPCVIIIAMKLFNCSIINFQNGEYVTKRFFDNEFILANNFFTCNLDCETKLFNLKYLQNNVQMKLLISTLTEIDFDNFLNTNIKSIDVSDSIVKFTNWKKCNGKNIMVISSQLKFTIDCLYSELYDCIHQNNRGELTPIELKKCNEIYLKLTYFLKTSTLNNFKQENIFKMSKTKKTKEMCLKFMQMLKCQFSMSFKLFKQQNNLSVLSGTWTRLAHVGLSNPQFPFTNCNHLFYKLRHSRIYKSNSCRHNNIVVSFQQTRCADEIATTVRFCQDCNRVISTSSS
jgi:DNA-directed RNA polymerase subunit M/transcription elongation factor TFIIS